jgi:hypothetical protein
MVSALDALEADFFGDLPQDTHGLWEVFELVRLYYPGLTNEEVFERGYDYISRWQVSASSFDRGAVAVVTLPAGTRAGGYVLPRKCAVH